MKILKFGGSSVAKPQRILQIMDILKGYYSRGEKFCVVFSAFGGVTDSLIEMCQLAEKGDQIFLEKLEIFKERHLSAVIELIDKENTQIALDDLTENHQHLKNLLLGISLLGEASPRTLDHVLSFGERNSAYIISHTMKQHGIHASYLDARKVITTNNQFNAAKVDFKTTNTQIKNYLKEHPEVQVITGFVASNAEGNTTTLGRGGSDYTSSIFAAALDAEMIEIWTDVDGVMTADPRKVSKAFTIPSMTYAEAMEMSHFGAKVIYPPTLQPALHAKIPLYIKNTFNPDFIGTLVSDKKDDGKTPVKGVTSINGISLLTLHGGGMVGVSGISARLFGALGRAKVNIVLITQGSSEHSISFAVSPQEADAAVYAIHEEFEYEKQANLIHPVKVENDLSVVAVVGENMRYRPGVAGRLFNSLGKNGVNIIAIAQGSSELNISTVIKKTDEAKALNAMHEAFFLSDAKVLHVFMVGVGLIGSTLIEQIRSQAEKLKKKQALEIKVVGLSNSRKMLFDANGIDLENWKEALDNNGEALTSIPAYVQKMKALNLQNSIFLDNTASKDVALHYESILDASISVSTPNKIAVSSSYLQYRRLKNIANLRNVHFMYETNVGAGLPVISTLNDLMNSGDSILKIEGVLSGSLSFIFNNFNEGTSFADIVNDAKKAGYTEPDPRTDLSGADVRRKILILARESGYALESSDIKINPILPEACMNAPSVDTFFEELVKANDYFEQQRATAAKDGKKLRVIATLENGEATIGMQAVDSNHPFYSLDGSDNMIVFTSERYKDRPLVILGPGAGAAVTAAGVFAEVITIGNLLVG